MRAVIWATWVAGFMCALAPLAYPQQSAPAIPVGTVIAEKQPISKTQDFVGRGRARATGISARQPRRSLCYSDRRGIDDCAPYSRAAYRTTANSPATSKERDLTIGVHQMMRTPRDSRLATCRADRSVTAVDGARQRFESYWPESRSRASSDQLFRFEGRIIKGLRRE